MKNPPISGVTWNSPLPSQRAVDDAQNRDRARAKFRDDAKKASTEYELERAATLQKTERLKALRLARDAEAQAIQSAKAASGAKTSKRRAK